MKYSINDKLLKCLFPIIVLLILPIAGRCQINKTKYLAEIEVIVSDTSLLKGTKLIFKIQQKEINTDYPGYIKLDTVELKKGITIVKLPLSTSINYIRIMQPQSGMGVDRRVLTEETGLFIVQNGDKVQLHFGSEPEDIFFTGNNSGKYNCQYKMANQTAYSVEKFNHYMSLEDYQRAYESVISQQDSVFTVQKHTLITYKSKINVVVYQLMLLDWQSHRDRKIAGLLRYPYYNNRPKEFATVKRLFTGYFGDKSQYKTLDPGLATQSNQFCDFMIELEKMSIIVGKSTEAQDYFRKISFYDIDSAINHDFQRGITKDKLMLISFLAMSRILQPDYVDFTDKAVSNSTNSVFRNELISFAERNRVGKSTFNFSLPDEDGKLHHLSDYKGKLVIIDFWFTGCLGCLTMAPKLKIVVDRYKSTPNIVFLTISIDKDKALWKSSLQKELYCSRDEINLLAENAEESKIIKYFNIMGFPTLIIFSKDGTLVTAAPPDPRDSVEKFVRLLDNHLQQNNPNR
jgi:thiol-disulfide isomerase/thioredoxin